jgi:hypothetical protein
VSERAHVSKNLYGSMGIRSLSQQSEARDAGHLLMIFSQVYNISAWGLCCHDAQYTNLLRRLPLSLSYAPVCGR